MQLSYARPGQSSVAEGNGIFRTGTRYLDTLFTKFSLNVLIVIQAQSLTYNILLLRQISAHSGIRTQFFPGQRFTASFGLNIGKQIIWHETKHFASISEPCGPVETTLLWVRLVRVVEIQVSGLGHNHLQN